MNSYEYSAIGSLGLNKILLVLKEVGENMSDKPKINIIIDNFANNKSNKNIFDFINKLLKNNIYSYEKNKIEKKELWSFCNYLNHRWEFIVCLILVSSPK